MASHKNYSEKTKLTLKNREFLDRFRSDKELNAGRCYHEVYSGVSEASAWSAASTLLRTKKAQAYLRQAAMDEKFQDGVKPTVESIIDELRKAAFFNPKELFTRDNRLKQWHELPDHIAQAISHIKHRTTTTTSENGKTIVKYDIAEIKLVGKEKTLELLGKHLVMFTEKFQIESEEAMHARVRAEIVAAGEETLAMVLANAKRQLVIDRAGPVPDDRPKSPDTPPDPMDPAYIASLL